MLRCNIHFEHSFLKSDRNTRESCCTDPNSSHCLGLKTCSLFGNFSKASLSFAPPSRCSTLLCRCSTLYLAPEANVLCIRMGIDVRRMRCAPTDINARNAANNKMKPARRGGACFPLFLGRIGLPRKGSSHEHDLHSPLDGSYNSALERYDRVTVRGQWAASSINVPPR